MNKKQAHDIHITLLDAENAGAFLPLLPPAARGWLDAPEGVAVGAVDGGISTAVGACAAHVEAGWLEIDWLWVEENARGNGAGWDLMMALIRSSADAGGIIGLSIRYAAESGENLTGFLERMNFGISDGFMNGF
ncbi:MAG: GNAT family N-acetyltransferase, partial [Clostridiales Family XIII bacterium]|nr:GNAT family N-acetyltransferase [Clostridiales Family XIII bacterium]